MKKICYVVTIPTTIEAFFLPQLHYLASNGFDVTVVCSYSSNLQEKLGRIPEDGEKPIIETKDVTYKIEDYEDKRILWVKACKNGNAEDNQDAK